MGLLYYTASTSENFMLLCHYFWGDRGQIKQGLGGSVFADEPGELLSGVCAAGCLQQCSASLSAPPQLLPTPCFALPLCLCSHCGSRATKSGNTQEASSRDSRKDQEMLQCCPSSWLLRPARWGPAAKCNSSACDPIKIL